ncbi:unnamed protein product [Larinioides sclopetarius]|uniref:Uncharacterized protein n=1 Tax=Larinioides sclopetarius TaxID=280406 RepID=A0AAV2A4Q4_9ARAC
MRQKKLYLQWILTFIFSSQVLYETDGDSAEVEGNSMIYLL